MVADSTLSASRAQAEQVRGQLAAAREGLAFLTGLPLEVALKAPEAKLPILPPLATYLSEVEKRPDVGSARFGLLAGEEGVSIARGAFLPSLDLNGNYFFKRAGALADVSWDVQFALSVPLFTGGANLSRLREARIGVQRAELSLGLARRQADLEIRTLHSTLVSQLAQVDELERARDSAEKSYQAQIQDYRLGLVTNLDVLQAMSAYRDARRALDQLKYNARINLARLESATGRAEVRTQ